jgi:hypothetical protein
VDCSSLELKGKDNLFESAIAASFFGLKIAADSYAYFKEGIEDFDLTLNQNSYVSVEKTFSSTLYYTGKGGNATVSLVNSKANFDVSCSDNGPFILLFSNSNVSFNLDQCALNRSYTYPTISSVQSRISFVGDSPIGSINSDVGTSIDALSMYIFQDSNIEGKLAIYDYGDLENIGSLKVESCEFWYAAVTTYEGSSLVCNNMVYPNHGLSAVYLVEDSFLQLGTLDLVTDLLDCEYSATINNSVVISEGQIFNMCDNTLIVNGDMNLQTLSGATFAVTSMLQVSGDLIIGEDTEITLMGNNQVIPRVLVIAKANKIVGTFGHVIQQGSIVGYGYQIYYNDSTIYFTLPSTMAPTAAPTPLPTLAPSPVPTTSPPPAHRSTAMMWVIIAAGFVVGLIYYGLAILIGLMWGQRRRNYVQIQ